MGMASALAVVGRRYTGTALQHPSIARHKPIHAPVAQHGAGPLRPMRSGAGAGLGVDGGPGGDGGAAAQATRSDEHVHRWAKRSAVGHCWLVAAELTGTSDGSGSEWAARRRAVLVCVGVPFDYPYPPCAVQRGGSRTSSTCSPSSCRRCGATATCRWSRGKCGHRKVPDQTWLPSAAARTD